MYNTPVVSGIQLLAALSMIIQCMFAKCWVYSVQGISSLWETLFNQSHQKYSHVGIASSFVPTWMIDILHIATKLSACYAHKRVLLTLPANLHNLLLHAQAPHWRIFGSDVAHVLTFCVYWLQYNKTYCIATTSESMCCSCAAITVVLIEDTYLEVDSST